MESRGHGDKLPQLKDAAIAALLQFGTVPKAAESIGVHPGTLRDWLKIPEFAEALAEARDSAYGTALGQLMALTSKAVTVLDKLLDSSNEMVAAKAVGLVLANTREGANALSFEDRIAELERAAAKAQGLKVRRPV